MSDPAPPLPPALLPRLRQAFGSAFDPARLTLVLQGNYGNARVLRLDLDDRVLAIKEYHSRSWFIRHTVGRFMIWQEVRSLAALAKLPGVPHDLTPIDAVTYAMEWINGHSLTQLHRDLNVRLPKSFFLELEELVARMHQAGVVHLDIRNLGNIMQGSDGRPYLLDFQSAFSTRLLPGFVRRIMEAADRSGIYKAWRLLCDEPLDPERTAFADRFKRWRKLWIFKGYWLSEFFRNRQQNEETASSAPPPPPPAP
ncbi:MAG: hypothetical protein GX803_06905 [Lentisphaerae bacterium]|nr:hypothetical protein [Lentisphaerota bacterium]